MNDFFTEGKNSDFSIHFAYTEKPVQTDFTMHTHELYELYYFISGSGTFIVEGNEYKLESGDILLLNNAEAHYFRIDDSIPYIRLTIQFSKDLFSGIEQSEYLFKPFEDRENGQKNLYRNLDFDSPYHMVLMNNLISNVKNKKLQTAANLLPLLYEIAVIFETKEETPVRNSLARNIINYINNNLLQTMNLDDLCSKFNVSKTHLCRLFKNATGTTVNNYIITKRLIYANNLIKSGYSPTNAALHSGFNDYTVFFKAYKKRYHISPSTAIKNKQITIQDKDN